MATFSGTVLIVGVPVVLLVLGLSIFLRYARGSSGKSQPLQKPKTLEIEKWETVDGRDYRRLRLYFRCLVCSTGWNKRFPAEGYETEDTRCPKCGASGTIGEIQELMRRDKEIELQIAQTEKRIADLKRLEEVKKEEQLAKDGKTRIVEA